MGLAAGGLSTMTPFAVLICAGIGFAYAFFPIMVIYLAWEPLVSALVPALARYRAFTKAEASYSAWRTRRLEESWRTLSGRAFERELASLFGRKGYVVEPWHLEDLESLPDPPLQPPAAAEARK